MLYNYRCEQAPEGTYQIIRYNLSGEKRILFGIPTYELAEGICQVLRRETTDMATEARNEAANDIRAMLVQALPDIVETEDPRKVSITTAFARLRKIIEERA